MTENKTIVWQNRLIDRVSRSRILGHNSCVIWLTGLSGSGKSTIATSLENELHHQGVLTYVLDGDNIRHGLNNNIGFSEADRKENIRRVGEVSKLFCDAGVITIVALISPFEEDRNSVRSQFSNGEFVEVFVKCPLVECENRDPKGLYKKVREGKIPNFTGIDSPYEEPKNPELVLETNTMSIEDCIKRLIDYLVENPINIFSIKENNT
ncbi:adenylyl-sulfate kinase [Cohnella suwonensis]|uniref:Adenylyl-sulfate kinase n=1 Tax=Cohnella suwonensis TaxID=696072 RepID=A0ABW0LYK6_9BACL